MMLRAFGAYSLTMMAYYHAYKTVGRGKAKTLSYTHPYEVILSPIGVPFATFQFIMHDERRKRAKKLNGIKRLLFESGYAESDYF